MGLVKKIQEPTRRGSQRIKMDNIRNKINNDRLDYIT
jgi:hypothetical protein